ncbi:MAG: lipase family alpha/beta hydrolase, partial [Microgenomates group bacterium]
EGNPDFHVFYYDWRKPVLENAQKLNDYIHTNVKPWNNKVNLIGHSLGGLVARTCVQKTANNCYADKLITVGSPHFGAVDAYPALEGGEIWRSGPIKLGYELLVHYFQQPGETRRETIERIAPVLKDLLPNFDYLIKNGSNLPPADLLFKNTLLPTLADLTPLENLTNAIAGQGFNSVEQIILTEPNWVDKLLGNWPDGKPEQKIYSAAGDGSVLLKSASFNNSNIPNFIYNLDHGGIVSEQEPLAKIMEILGLTLKPGTYNSLVDDERFLVFLAHSPVKLSSPDITSDSYINDELIIIPSPQNKVYTLNVEGTGSGFYTLSVGQIGTESANWQDYYGEVQTGKTQNLQFNIDIENPPKDPLEGSQSFCSSELDSLLDQCRNLANSQIANQKYKNIILYL